ncbi:MAG: hypothetical protein JSU94_12765 [Phycisphaerales bacterium]|nr:MAG: hypothetical protein JSU94_12765 [Phycisphaerales bacterium]
MKNRILTTFTLIGLFAAPAFSAERLVPLVYENIQAAIDASNEGDVVLVAPGTYTGPGNRNIDLKGKAITVQSNNPADPQTVATTIIDCEGLAGAFVLRTGEGADSKIAGLTITNGKAFLGGGIYCQISTSPTIEECVITKCAANLGGGALACGGGSAPTIVNCTMSGNSAFMGGAIYSNASSPSISNCLLVGNTANTGGGVYCTVSSCTVNSCTFSANSSGIYSSNQADVTIKDSILWADTPGPELFVSKSGGISMMVVSFCDVQGGKQAVVVEQGCILSWGYSNINTDPVFESGPLGGYYLAQTSYCIDAGSATAAALGLDQFTTSKEGNPDAGIVDMGYHRRCPRKTIAATIDIKQDIVDLAAKAPWLMCAIELASGYNASDILPETIRLQGEIAAEKVWLGQSGSAKARFSRSRLRGVLDVGSEVQVTVTGTLVDGSMFMGTDVVQVVDEAQLTQNGKK